MGGSDHRAGQPDPGPAVDVLGVPVHPVGLEDLLDRVGAAIATGGPFTLTYANVHVLNTAARDGRLTRFLRNVDLCFCDGNGVRLGARILGRQLPHRMTGADWIWDLAARAEAEGWRIYWIGGEPGVTAEAAERLRARHPGLQVATDHGFHPRSGPEDEACIARINAFSPHIVLVGMGTPVQEYWTEERRDRIEAPVVWCLGATADFIAGRTARGPRWFTDRFEWVGRLVAEPRRLWKRYLLGNPVFLLRVTAQRLGRPQER
ncbi:MAG: WecB/TagA/CpsF family glycosyltransferase [Deltaproteobacteria bacterium]|nr:MAG: WecB/TagA/CpsF family glycosyltransferase [Deltaproteobacteria bacterium]